MKRALTCRWIPVGWAALALLAAGAAFPPAATAQVVAPEVQFSEQFGDVAGQAGVTQRGTFRIQAVLPMAGVDIGDFDGNTGYHVSIGNLGDSGRLGEDARYSPGRRRVRIQDGTLQIRLRFSRRRARIIITAPTGTLPPLQLPIQADDFLDDPAGPVNGTTAAFVSFGPVSQRFDVPYAGQKTLNRGMRRVTLQGNGVPGP
jgi:hypothetical protein